MQPGLRKMRLLELFPIIRSQSGNDTNVNVHVGFSRWGVTVYCSKSVYGSALSTAVG